MKVAVALLVLFAVSTYAATTEPQLQRLFTNWMRQNEKVYSADEFQHRYAVWKDNFHFVEDFNTREATFTVALNKFADLSNSEFVAIYNGLKMNKEVQVDSAAEFVPQDPSLPTSVDWRNEGIVTGVKNQGQCGSCWSFSATGSLEGAHARNTGKLVSLSEQNLVDCSTSQGNNGCNGGLMDYAFQYVINNRGIDTEESYPYTARDGTCKYNPANCGSTLKAYADVTPRQSESALQTASANIGPVSVAIDASRSSFQFYSSGVYYEPSCSSTQLDHGVLCVGYGTSGGQDYWIVKNSWGASWGMNGYIWMARNRSNNCGIATMASYPIASGAGNC